MKRTLICKAYLMIFIIIFSVFTIYIPKVEASTNVCCEQTTSNLGGINACIYTDIGNCVPDKQKEQVACEQTNYCTLGTCVVNGQCSSNVYKQQCSKVINDCASAPDARCVSNKCVRVGQE